MSHRAILVMLFGLVLAACTGGSGDAADTVERYIQAKVDGDLEALRSLLCSDLESTLEREARSFESVTGITLEGMACTRDGEGDIVQCDGKIVAEYGTETTEFQLTSYRVVREDGEWKWCGEAG